MEAYHYPRPKQAPSKLAAKGDRNGMSEEEKSRKLVLLSKWEVLQKQYQVMVLQRKFGRLMTERESLWLQFPEESLLRMIGDLERKIKEFSEHAPDEVEDIDSNSNIHPKAVESLPRPTAAKEQNADKAQNWGPYQ